jgi:hypothetical protein
VTGESRHGLIGSGLISSLAPSLMREPELQDYVALKTPKEKISAQLSDGVAFAIDRWETCVLL